MSRIFENCYHLVSEIYRDLYEMGIEVHPETMQNKDIRNDDNYITKENMNYSYCLLSLEKSEYLFLPDNRGLKYCKEELLNRFNSKPVNPGTSWLIRKDVWEPFLDNRKMFEYTYSERIWYQIPKIKEQLTKNPNTRQAILSVWNPVIDIINLGGIKRVPCSVYYQFILRGDMLHVIYNMRSCDLVTHFGIDVYLAYSTMERIANEIGKKPGYLYHNIGSLHAYKKDWPTLKKCIGDLKD